MRSFISVIAEGEISVLKNFSDDFNNKSSDAYKKLTADFSTVVFIIHVHNSIKDSFLEIVIHFNFFLTCQHTFP